MMSSATASPQNRGMVTATRPLTGEEYLESLRDGREVWIYGECIKDITMHPGFRNTARMVARLYDGLHDPATKDLLTCETDTGNGGYTHRFFRAATSATDLVAASNAIGEWARMTYGWMGRSPDYKASFLSTLQVNAEYYAPYQANAHRWYKEAQEKVLYLNHAIVDPPIDRQRPKEEVDDVYMHVERETDAGIIVSGAKTVATNSALTHHTLVAQISPVRKPEFALNFILPMATPGVKLICRPSYQMMAQVMGSPFDYPLSSRLDENDAILVCDRVLVPWENIFIYGDLAKIATFMLRSGFQQNFALHGCIRLAVKLDFLSGLLLKAVEMTGSAQFRGVQVHIGEVLAWRNLFSSLTEAMTRAPEVWENGAVLPNKEAGLAYLALAPNAYTKIKAIFEDIVASGLIYQTSHAIDFQTPQIRRYLDQYARGSEGQDAVARMKLTKLIWDAIGTEFGGRHELYERNYSGSHEVVRLNNYWHAQSTGQAETLKTFVDRCLNEYDLKGWTCSDLVNSTDINFFQKS